MIGKKRRITEDESDQPRKKSKSQSPEPMENVEANGDAVATLQAPLEFMDLPVDILYSVCAFLDMKSLLSFSLTSTTMHSMIMDDSFHESSSRAACGSRAACSRLWGEIFYRQFNHQISFAQLYNDILSRIKEVGASGEFEWDKVLSGFEYRPTDPNYSFVREMREYMVKRSVQAPHSLCSANSACSLWYLAAPSIIPAFWQLWGCGLMTSSGEVPTHKHFHPPAPWLYRSVKRTARHELEDEQRSKYKTYRVPCWKKLIEATHVSLRLLKNMFRFSNPSQMYVHPAEALYAPMALRARFPPPATEAEAPNHSLVTDLKGYVVPREDLLRHTMRLGPAAVVYIVPLAKSDIWRNVDGIDMEKLQEILDVCGIEGFSEVTVGVRDVTNRIPCMLLGCRGDFFVGVGSFHG